MWSAIVCLCSFSNGVYAVCNVLVPIVLRQRLGYSLVTVGSVLSASSSGLIIGSLLLGCSPRLTRICVQQPLLCVLWAFVAQGVLILLLLLEPGALFTAMGGALYYALDAPIISATACLLRRSAPLAMQGRLSSLRLFLITVGQPICNSLLPTAVDLLGVYPLIATLGTSVIALSLLLFSLRRKLEEQPASVNYDD